MISTLKNKKNRLQTGLILTFSLAAIAIIVICGIQLITGDYAVPVIAEYGVKFLSVKMISSIFFMLLAISFILFNVKKYRISTILSSIGFVFSLYFLTITFFELDFNILKYSQLVMSGTSALCFSALFFSIASFPLIKKYPVFLQISFMLLIIVWAIVTIVLVSYFAKLAWLYDIDLLNYTSPLACVFFTIFSLGLLTSLIIEIKKQDAQLRYLPLTVFTVAFLFFIMIWHFSLYKTHNVITSITTQAEIILERKINYLLDQQNVILVRMVNHWQEEGYINEHMWHYDAKAVIKDSPLFDNMIFLNPAGQLMMSEPQGISYNKNLLQPFLKKYQKSKKFELSFIYITNDGKPYFYCIYPVYGHDGLKGFLLAKTNLDAFFDTIISPLLMLHYNIFIYHNNTIAYQSTPYKNTKIGYYKTNTSLAKNNFKVNVIPTYLFKKMYFTEYSVAILAIGIFFSLLLALFLYFLQASRRLSRNYQTLLKTAGEGIFGLNRRSLVTFINPAAQQMLGYSPDELIGNPPFFLGSEAIAKVGKFTGRTFLKNKAGESFPVFCISRTLLDKKDNDEGRVVIFNDIRKLVESRNKLAQRTAQLEASNKELESFSYSVSHDLLAPLRHISSFIELLQADSGNTLTEDSKENFSIIVKSAKKMADLINDLLQFSRAGRLELHKETFSTNELLDEIVHEYQHELQQRNIKITYGNLPEVNADRSMIKQVFENLLTNSLKFTMKRKQVIIKVQCIELDDGFYQFSFSDNGVGFDDKYSEKMFGVFQRLHSEKEYPGTGIGLANVARIIGRHGGTITAKGEVDKGATFYFTLPKM